MTSTDIMFGASWPIEGTVHRDISESAVQNFISGLVSADEYKISYHEAAVEGIDEFTNGLQWSLDSNGVWYAKD
jgi:hypothetical protein